MSTTGFADSVQLRFPVQTGRTFSTTRTPARSSDVCAIAGLIGAVTHKTPTRISVPRLMREAFVVWAEFATDGPAYQTRPLTSAFQAYLDVVPFLLHAKRLNLLLRRP